MLRSNLLKSTITFKLANAIDLKNSFNDKYDLIFLSNILNYFRYVWQDNWTIETLIDYINGLDKIEDENCDLLLHYVFSGKSNIFTGAQVKLEEIPNSSVITFSGLLQGNEKMIVIKK